MAVAAAVAVMNLAVLPAASAQDPNTGIGAAVEMEATLVRRVQTRSDAWKNVAQFIPIIGWIFAMSQRVNVWERHMRLEGTFLGMRFSGTALNLEIQSYGPMGPGSFSVIPVNAVFETPAGRLHLNVVGPPGGEVRVEADPSKGTGAFAGVVARGTLRIFTTQEGNALVRGRIVVGWESREQAEQALLRVYGGDDPEGVRRAVRSAPVEPMPFPWSDKPPARTLVRWGVVRRAGDAAEVRVVALAGREGSEQNMVRIRIIAVSSDGSRSDVFDGAVTPGEQIDRTFRVKVPAVVMVLHGARAVAQFTVGAEE